MNLEVVLLLLYALVHVNFLRLQVTFCNFLDLKQELQVQERNHTDNNKSVDRVRSIVDSNKLQAELESNSPASQVVPPIPPSNTTLPLKSRIHNTFIKAKRIFHSTSRKH